MRKPHRKRENVSVLWKIEKKIKAENEIR
jgi:hypothetical protein